MALQINGERVEDEVIRSEAQVLRPRCAQLFADNDALTAEMQLRELAKRRVVERIALRQLAELDSTPIPQEALGQVSENCVTPMNASSVVEDARTQAQLDRLVAKIIGNVPRPKRKEALDYFRGHPNDFESPELIRAAHIVKNVDEYTSESAALQAIEEVRQKLESGAEFGDLADAHSDCPGNGGNLGWFPRGQMVEEFDAVVFVLEVGQISPVFRTPFGFHIAKVLEHAAARTRSFDEVQSELVDQLYRRKQHYALDEFVSALVEAAEVRRVK